MLVEYDHVDDQARRENKVNFEGLVSESNNFSLQHKNIMLQLAREVIDYGIDNRMILPIILENYPKELLLLKACFVTLYTKKQLRGCIGNLEANVPLISRVVENSFKAAFSDPRFIKVTKKELAALNIEISILTTPAKMDFVSEEDLISKLQPNIDGLILKASPEFVGTFLPSVWQQLPNPVDFLKQLKIKAGLPISYWNDKIEIFKYKTEIFNDLQGFNKF